jgi:3D (Asp-Asp-Asp) domain-containing protein
MLSALVAASAVALASMPGQAADPIGDFLQSMAMQPSATQATRAPDVSASGPEIQLQATLYHAGAAGVGNKDSLGCRVVPMRTVAIDKKLIPRRSILFIKETVGMQMPGGGVHDGVWYASDVGGAIKGQRIDLYTGHGAGSMKAFYARGINKGAITAKTIGQFDGCPMENKESGEQVALR